MKRLKLKVTSRQEFGRGPARRLRAAGLIPAVVYGKSGNRSLSIDSREFRELNKRLQGSAALIEIVEDGKDSVLTVIQEAERHALRDEYTHIDFHEVVAGESMTAFVQVHLIGEAKGVKEQGGLLDFQTHELEVRCLPKDLPDFIEVAIADLEIGHVVHVRDLKLAEGVSIVGDEDRVIIACTAPRVTAADAEADAEEAAAEEAKAAE